MRLGIYTAAACLASLLALASCGGAGGGGGKPTEGGQKISVRYDGRESSWEPRDAVFTTYGKGLVLKDADMHDKAGRAQGVVHRIYLASYDLGMMPGRPPSYRPTPGAEHFRVEIQLEAASGADENAPPRAGDYSYKAEPYDRLSYVFVTYHRDGKDISDNLQPSRMRGAVRIESAGEGRISGVIDVTDGQESVSGSFTARKL